MSERIKLFDEIPVLENERIVLRQITDADADAVGVMTRSRLIYRYEPSYLFERQYTDMHEMIRALYGELYQNKESLILGVFLKGEDQLCGLAEFYDFNDRMHKASIGYRLREEYWGKGIATDTVKLMADYLLTRTDVEIITASTTVENEASAHVLEKNGFLMTSADKPEDWGHEQPTRADRWFL